MAEEIINSTSTEEGNEPLANEPAKTFTQEEVIKLIQSESDKRVN